jgi:hypothetical protein
MQTPYLLESLASGHSVVETLIGRIDSQHYDTVVSPDRFTVREIVAHLADWEAIWRERAEHGQAQTEGTVQAMDEGERAAAQNYATWNVEQSLAIYVQRRADFVARVRSLSAEEMDRAYQHPQYGPVTVWVHCVMLAGHDLYHIQQLLDYQAELMR